MVIDLSTFKNFQSLDEVGVLSLSKSQSLKMTKQNKFRSESVNPFKRLAIDDKLMRESKPP